MAPWQRPTKKDWLVIWDSLHPSDQEQALDAFLNDIRSDQDHSDAFNDVIDELAEAAHFRKQMLRRWPTGKLRQLLHRYITKALPLWIWNRLFVAFYKQTRSAMMNDFLDALEILHDNSGMITADSFSPTLEDIAKASARLKKIYPPDEVVRYFRILLFQDESWAPLGAEVEQLSSAIIGASPDTGPVAATLQPPQAADHEEDASSVSDEFTTLDRVLVDQTIATISGTEGALSPDALEDLIDTAVNLNAHWHRGYFHVGFMDTLVPGHDLTFDRSEFNDPRREWYLAGVLTALARRRDEEAIRRVLSERSADFQRAAARAGGPGATMARTLLNVLVDFGRISEVAALLRGQIEHVGLLLAQRALSRAADLLRKGAVSSATPLLQALWQQRKFPAADADEVEPFLLELQRRMGQSLQAQGDFQGAKSQYDRLMKQGGKQVPPGVYGDFALAEAGFKTLTELRLPAGRDKRDAMAASLRRAAEWFEKARNQAPSEAVTANFALGLLGYLEWFLHTDDKLREQSLEHMQRAITGMRTSDAARSYEDLGLLGQALLIQAILQFHRLDPVDAGAAYEAWTQITGAGGRFPFEDLTRLLEVAELVDIDIASRIAESVWDFHGREALTLIVGGGWIESAKSLCQKLASVARDSVVAPQDRWKIWLRLVPPLLRAGENDAAAEGLDQLETLATTKERWSELEMWLGDHAHFEPVWDPEEALWTRARLGRLQNADDRCVMYPRTSLVEDQYHGLRALLDRINSQLAIQRPGVSVANRPALDAGQMLAQSLDVEAKSLAETLPVVEQQGIEIILTTPESLKNRMLDPRAVRTYLRHVEVVVFDEIHLMEGLAGCHGIYFIRRLRQLLRDLRQDPKFEPAWVGASATVAEPVEHCARVLSLDQTRVAHVAPTSNELARFGTFHHIFLHTRVGKPSISAVTNGIACLVHTRNDCTAFNHYVDPAAAPLQERPSEDIPKTLAFVDSLRACYEISIPS